MVAISNPDVRFLIALLDIKAIEIASLRQIIIYSVNNSLLEKRDFVFLLDTRAISEIVRLDRLKIFYNSNFSFREVYISSIASIFLYITVNIFIIAVSHI